MNSSQLPGKHDPKTILGKALVDLGKVELPEMIEKNLIRSACRLITGVVDIPVAWLKSVERNISRETEALDLISKSNSEDIVKMNSQDNEFIQSTSNYYSLKQFKEASNRRSLLNLTINDLNKATPLGDVEAQIDEDWLDLYSRIAETKSNDEVRFVFARILSNEIRKPGSISLKLLKTLELLTPDIASSFQDFCSYVLDWEGHRDAFVLSFKKYPKDEFGSDEYSPSLNGQVDLIDFGLVRPNKQSLMLYDDLLTEPFYLGDTKLEFTRNPGSFSDDFYKNDSIILTDAGRELCRIIDKPIHASTIYYLEDFFKRVDEKIPSIWLDEEVRNKLMKEAREVHNNYFGLNS